MSKTTDTRPFRFKQFSINHHRSTMKVGTDAVLLSAWVNIENVNKALDVGTGSGIIAMMLAARGVKHIDAVELDESSFKESSENFKNSQLDSELTVYNKDFTTYAGETNERYDLVISNPPFFTNDMLPDNKKKLQARHTETLTFTDLISGAVRLLDPEGKLVVVLPYYQSQNFVEEAGKNNLFVSRKLLIFPKPCKEPNRVNLEFSQVEKEPVTEKFIIREENGNFTDQYKSLLGKYYLNIPE